MLLCALFAGGPVAAQNYPDRTIRIIDAFPAGGAADYLARVIGPKITANLGRQIVVENRPGAGGTLGASMAAKSPPDGYTLFMGSLTGIAASPSHGVAADSSGRRKPWVVRPAARAA